MSIPALELVRYTFFDTKELPPDGSCAKLEFFSNSNPDQQLSNWPTRGTLPHPQQFYLFGLLLNIYSANPPPSSDDLQAMRKALVDNCNISYIIGHKHYLDVPVTSTVNGLLPGDAPEIYKNMLQVPEVKEQDEIHVKYGVVEGKGSLEKISGRIVNPEPGDFFYGMCIFRRDKQMPLHISCAQFIQAALTWPEVKGYDAGVLGKAHFRVSMLGVWCREAM